MSVSLVKWDTLAVASTARVFSSRSHVRVCLNFGDAYDFQPARGDVREYIAECVREVIAEESARFARRRPIFHLGVFQGYDGSGGVGWARAGYTLGGVREDYGRRGAYEVTVYVPRARG